MSEGQTGKPGLLGQIRVIMETGDGKSIKLDLTNVSIVKENEKITRITGTSYDIFAVPKSK
ncbi:hypothetical protein [Lihuaxuella thermophila]|uniref:Uncharacterized protein n=1 Tax=Lihuaxuella thermophila TaxID=1173111 RepID=A0A1H8FA08_9BACL|nr:hypothetical protein [Lihuaxuella thermophila]SEN28643.1 hypothetical protein SAMN05444955_10894 [Lihuaxuella thermophila]